MAGPVYKVDELINYLVQLGIGPENGGDNSKWHPDMGKNGSEKSLRLNVGRGRVPDAVDIAETLDGAGIPAKAALGENGPYVYILESDFSKLNPGNFGVARYAIETLFKMETAGGKPGQYVSVDDEPEMVNVRITPELILLAGLSLQSKLSSWEESKAQNGDPNWSMDFPAEDRGRLVKIDATMRGAGIMSEIEKKPDGSFSLFIRQSNAGSINDISVKAARTALAPVAAMPESRADISRGGQKTKPAEVKPA